MKYKILFVVIYLFSSISIFASNSLTVPSELWGNYVSNEIDICTEGEEPLYLPMVITAEISKDNIRVKMVVAGTNSSSTIDYKAMLDSGIKIVDEYVEPGFYGFTYRNKVEMGPGIVSEADVDVMIFEHGDAVVFFETSLDGWMETIILFYPVGV